jgi:hypothetical protein
MKKLLNFFYVEDYRRDMTTSEKRHRDNKVAGLLLIALMLTVISMAPLYAETCFKVKRFQVENEWICPNKACKYDNYDEIRYCGLCGTEKPARRR